MNLRLEYACTRAEMAEAQELNTTQQLGRGSKWRARLWLWLFLGVVLAGMAFRIQREFSPAERPYVVGLVALVTGGVLIWQTRAKKTPLTPTTIELSDTGLAIIDSGHHRVDKPWNAFSQCLESNSLFVLLDRPKVVMFVVPKRAFPDPNAVTSFRDLAQRCGAVSAGNSEGNAHAVTAHSGPAIQVRFRLGYRDYVARTLASGRTWSILALIAMIVVGAAVAATFAPPPNARPDRSPMAMLVALIPIGVTVPLIVLLVAFQQWRAHAGYHDWQTWRLSDSGLEFTGRDEHGSLPWSAYPRYKETRRCFIVWNPSNAAWLLLPKRAFNSFDDVRQCRELLSRQVRPSRWFFG